METLIVKKAESSGKTKVGAAKIEHLLNKGKIIVETMGNFLHISTSKKNICHKHYYRGSSTYANFITAIFQNFPGIFGLCVFWLI